MTIPLKIRRQIERVENNLTKLRRKSIVEFVTRTESDVDLELHTYCRELSDCCDQVANDLWCWLNPNGNSRKPNIYWPNSRDETIFSRLLRQQQMSNLDNFAPEVLQKIRDTQLWHNSTTSIPTLKSIASNRHTEILGVELKVDSEISIGRGGAYIEKATIEDGQIVELKGTEFSGGAIRAISAQHRMYPYAIDLKSSRELFSLISSGCIEIKSCCAVVYGRVIL